MIQRTDWFPTGREAILAMARNWQDVTGSETDAFGIPTTVLTGLGSLITAANTALIKAQNETTRTPVATAQCKTAFEALTAAMRDIKKRYFLTPPLEDADYVSLGLRIPDSTPTPSGDPSAQVMVETYLVGRHELGIKIIYVTGSAADPANKGYRIWYSLIAPGETPPVNPDDLRKSFFTKRKKDLIEFDFGDSGKTAYVAVQIENNEGKKGPWGPLVSALIP
ncbi:MAG: hypothetical protein LBQ77_00220 [Treponema sp.]|jgi:hypothetical protein|nr:hypothetical protein [Treponema sp.]